MNISMIAEQPRLLFVPVLLLSHPPKSEDINDYISDKRLIPPHQSPNVLQYVSTCLICHIQDHQSCNECHQNRVCNTYKLVGTRSTSLATEKYICPFFWMVKTPVKWWGKHQYAESTNLQTSYKDNEYFSLTLTPAAGKHCLKSVYSNHLHKPDATSSQSWPVPALQCLENH